MSYSSKDEQERLKRLRDQQISSRDPQAKERIVQHKVTQRRKTTYRQTTTGDVLKATPKKIGGCLIGVLLGAAILLGLYFFWDSPYKIILGVAALVALAVLGSIFGSSLDWRDEIRRNL